LGNHHQIGRNFERSNCFIQRRKIIVSSLLEKGEEMLRLKEIRTGVGLSGAALSKLSGVSVRTIEDIERRGDCRISTARLLCDALKITLDEFYTADKEEAGE
jgi:DNA-binding XRE family transcriptional regulator